jgi:hypothetical protein
MWKLNPTQKVKSGRHGEGWAIEAGAGDWKNKKRHSFICKGTCMYSYLSFFRI